MQPDQASQIAPVMIGLSGFLMEMAVKGRDPRHFYLRLNNPCEVGQGMIQLMISY